MLDFLCLQGEWDYVSAFPYGLLIVKVNLILGKRSEVPL